ncbi:hypothetical protein K9M79_00405 [Candidatus Woesearchaeota archaeon]|nr:hypothetical protein [Candidatus Woesearchaeota archaeon]
MINFKIPIVWDTKYIDEMIDIAESGDIVITEMYGSLPIEKSGRTTKYIENISFAKAYGILDYLRNKGIKFNYLFNSIYQKNEIDTELITKVMTIIDELEPELLTLANIELMKKIGAISPKQGLTVSTVFGIDSLEKISLIKGLKRQGLNIKEVVLHHDCNIRRDLDNLIMELKKCNIRSSLIVNENCTYGCKRRDEHFKWAATAIEHDNSDYCLRGCVRDILISPWKILSLTGLIRPEDLDFYKKIGLDTFKLSGRHKPKEYLINTFRHYARRKYSGNMINLLTFSIPPGKQAKELFYVENSMVTSIKEKWKSEPTRFAILEAKKLYEKELFRINDEGSKYELIDGSLKNKKPGKYLEKISKIDKCSINMAKKMNHIDFM